MIVRRSPELEEYAREVRDAYERRDDEWFRRHTADGEVVSFGTDPEEIWRGREAVLGLTTAQVHAMNDEAGVRFEQGEIEAYEAGDTGWVLVHGGFVTGDGSTFPTRSLTVLMRENGEWKMGITGISLVVPNALMTPGSPLAAGAASS
jgi:hypothetical protein